MDERSQLLIKKFLRTFARRAEIFNLAAGMGWEKVPSQMAKYLANRDDDLRKSSHRSKRLFHLIQRFASPPRYLAAKSMRAARRRRYGLLHSPRIAETTMPAIKADLTASRLLPSHLSGAAIDRARRRALGGSFHIGCVKRTSSLRSHNTHTG